MLLATDEDREGEAISWHVLEVLKPVGAGEAAGVPRDHRPGDRATPSANPRELDMRLVEAQEGRRKLDRLFGYEMSVVTRRRAGGATSAGRVQSVAARLVVERERARMAFRAASYWDLEGTFAARGHRVPGDARCPSTGSRLASGRDFEPTTGQLAAGADVALVDEARAARARRGAGATPRSGSSRSRRRPRSSGPGRRSRPRRSSRRPAASSGSPRPARWPSRRASTSTATSPTCAPTPRSSPTRRSPRPARRSATGTARSTCRPSRASTAARSRTPRRPTRRSGPPVTRCALPDDIAGELNDRRAAHLRPHLEADRRLPDGRRP